MNKLALSGISLAAMLFAGTASAAASVSGLVGMRFLDKDDWEPTENQPMIGVIGDFSFGNSPIFLEVGLRVSADSDEIEGTGGEPDADVTLSVADFSLGLGFRPTQGAVRPYLGFGVASVGIAGEIEGDGFFDDDEDDDDQSFGAYASAGVLVPFRSGFMMGVDVRYLGGTDLELFGLNADVDSYTVAFRAGYSWE